MNSISLRFLEVAKVFENDLTIRFDMAVSEERVYIINNPYFIVFPVEILFLSSNPRENSEADHIKKLLLKDLVGVYEKISENHYRICIKQFESDKFVQAYNKEFSYASKLYYCYAKHIISSGSQTTFSQYTDFM